MPLVARLLLSHHTFPSSGLELFPLLKCESTDALTGFDYKYCPLQIYFAGLFKIVFSLILLTELEGHLYIFNLI